MPVYQNLSDNELISFLREGDAAAYTEIYDRYFQLMFVFAYKKLRDEELAKDFVQDLFERLWIKRSTVQEGNFVQYLYITMRSRLLNYFDHQKVQNKYVEFLAGFDSSYEEGTDHVIREKQLNGYIEQQIAKLPVKMKAVLELSRKQHFTNKEIAKLTDTSESSVSQHIKAAVKILKTKLQVLFFLF